MNRPTTPSDPYRRSAPTMLPFSTRPDLVGGESSNEMLGLRGRLLWRSIRRGLAAGVLAVAWILALPGVASGQQDEAGAGGDAAAPLPAAPAVESQTSLLDVYRQGGWIMHILLACSAGTIAVVIYCFVQVTPGRMAPAGINETLIRNMRRRDVTNAYELCDGNPSSFTRVVSAALLKCDFERELANKFSMEQAASETLDQEETRQMLWINYLNVFATIAPMVGLLGTVTGMITSFGQLARGASEPSDLAGGIGEAMATTAGGLIVGIPAMFFFFFFRNRLMAIVARIQKDATFLIDILSGEVRIAGDEPADPAATEDSRPGSEAMSPLPSAAAGPPAGAVSAPVE